MHELSEISNAVLGIENEGDFPNHGAMLTRTVDRSASDELPANSAFLQQWGRETSGAELPQTPFLGGLLIGCYRIQNEGPESAGDQQ